MKASDPFQPDWKTSLFAGATTALAGMLFAVTPLGDGLRRLSFDLPQCLCSRAAPAQLTNVVIIYMDEQAYRDYGQKADHPWDRTLHARLLDRLTADQPAVVVLDLFLAEPGTPQKNARLATAITSNARVVLAAQLDPTPGFKGSTLHRPLPEFATNAAGLGIAQVIPQPDWVARRCHPGRIDLPSLAWAASEVAKAEVTRDPERRLRETRWLNYYGPSGTFLGMSYTNAETQAPGFFSGKFVFVGQKPKTPFADSENDEFATPHTRWQAGTAPGVEVMATAFMNLMLMDWLRAPGTSWELALLLLAGAGLGVGATRLRPFVVLWLSPLTAVVVFLLALALQLQTRFWFAWAVIAAVQVPCALLARVGLHFRAPASPPALQTLEADQTPTVKTPSAPLLAPADPRVPDHELLQRIGRGAYGQIWLARNAVGMHHAVKIVHRSGFDTDAPYERAFRGIQKFMPVSRSHAGFVHILHVGRNEIDGYFYYVMEPADDIEHGQHIQPATYRPKSLGTVLRRRGCLPAQECLALMLDLTDAVEHLHQRQLIHRDIKPANIIYVEGCPKLADIDLVTDLNSEGKVSYLGTEGYLAPEGPGAPAADVYSLGRVLYVASTGHGPDLCPNLPTRLAAMPETALHLELNRIVCQACDPELRRRYPSAAVMREDLRKLAATARLHPPTPGELP